MTTEIMKFILGGGGVALLAALGKLGYDWLHGRVMREESAVTQWQGIARSRLEEINRLRTRLTWFEANYALLWVAYARLPPDDKPSFPFAPPPLPDDVENESES